MQTDALTVQRAIDILDTAFVKLHAAVLEAQGSQQKSALLHNSLNRLGQTIKNKQSGTALKKEEDILSYSDSLTKQKKEVYSILQSWLYNATVNNKIKARQEVEVVKAFLDTLLNDVL